MSAEYTEIIYYNTGSSTSYTRLNYYFAIGQKEIFDGNMHKTNMKECQLWKMRVKSETFSQLIMPGGVFTQCLVSPLLLPSQTEGSDAWQEEICWWQILGSVGKCQDYTTLSAISAKDSSNTNMFTSDGLLAFWRYLATKARCESRCSLVSIISPSFSLFSYSWNQF